MLMIIRRSKLFSSKNIKDKKKNKRWQQQSS
jgi:hypothetical protein